MHTSLVTKLDDNLRDELAMFGVVRAVAAVEAPVSKKKANFFGIEKQHDGEVELLFTDDEEVLADAVEDGMELGVVAPEHESFNMLVQKDFKKAIADKDPKSLREFVTSILDAA